METFRNTVRIMVLFVYPEPLFIDGQIIVLFN
jgi:hypothetical protein